jgi:hypothetical protein
MNESTTEKVAYEAPVVVDHGSIADHTFSTPARKRKCKRGRCAPIAPPGLSGTF